MLPYVGVALRTAFIWLAVSWMFCNAEPARAEVLIRSDRGGLITDYLEKYERLRVKGESIAIDGDCLSACTLALGILPKNHVCTTPRAKLGFHAAWDPDENGQPVTNAFGTAIFWDNYPSRVRRWIKKHGGLTRRMIYLKGKDLAILNNRCKTLPRDTFVQAPTRERVTIYAGPVSQQ